ncbi:UNVERIFIED_CONTAM: hypothetical protein Slati_4421300 [Sesamum latifolium]|uniref:Uncharacterized protein n=1 Tax=Sesamum latifolium TaxID=2727402 RepID=A0AAW2SPU3_9LAMI
MKGSCALVASVVAASTVAFTSSTSGGRDVSFNSCANQGKSVNSRGVSDGKGKYAPKFDGLRFIETLVTAHR